MCRKKQTETKKRYNLFVTLRQYRILHHLFPGNIKYLFRCKPFIFRIINIYLVECNPAIPDF
jgi:hypothetical protein